MKFPKIITIIIVTLLLLALFSACSPSGLGTALGVKEEFQKDDQGGIYKLTGDGFSGKYRIGQPPDEIQDLTPVKLEVEATVGREPGHLYLAFDAPNGETPLIMDLQGGETMTGSGIGLVSSERVMMDINAFKVGAGQVQIVVKFTY